MRRTNPLIVGGGPAGAAAAILLARGGAKLLLIDRNREPPDQLCGGFLGWDALAALRSLGIDAAKLGARPIGRIRLIAGDTVVEHPLPFLAAGLSRRTLDAALLERAVADGAHVDRGVAVRTAEPAARSIRLDDGTDLAWSTLFLATGKHDLRGSPRLQDAVGPETALGLRTRFAPSPRIAASLAGVIELHLFRHGYAGLLLQEDGAANLCLSLTRSRFAAAGGDTATLIAALTEAPRLADRWSEAAAPSPWQAIGRVPYGWRATTTSPGLFRIGDQAAVIASLAGDGVAIALASGKSGALAYLRDGDEAAPAFQRQFARASRRPLTIAGGLRWMGESPAAATLLSGFGRLPGMTALLARATRIGHE